MTRPDEVTAEQIAELTDSGANLLIKELIGGIKTDQDRTDVLSFIKAHCQRHALGPTTLGMVFEVVAGIDPTSTKDTDKFTTDIPVDNLVKVHPGFRSTNGNQWARSDSSYLGKKYRIKRTQEGGRVAFVRLDGPNKNSLKVNRSIRKDIRDEISSRRCAVLGTSNPEVDHKSGRYNELANQNAETQVLEDFQPLSKAANDAKRNHCSRCLSSGKRYDARINGYKDGWILGDADTAGCEGCYWYDVRRFNELISKNHKAVCSNCGEPV